MTPNELLAAAACYECVSYPNALTIYLLTQLTSGLDPGVGIAGEGGNAIGGQAGGGIGAQF